MISNDQHEVIELHNMLNYDQIKQETTNNKKCQFVCLPFVFIMMSLTMLFLHLVSVNNRPMYHIETQSIYSKLELYLIFNKDSTIEFWQYITYMFVHKDVLHLGINMIAQLYFGISLECKIGQIQSLILYFFGGLGGSILFQILSTDGHILVGASAGLYALIAVYFCKLILYRRKTVHQKILLFVLTLYMVVDIFNWLCIGQHQENINYLPVHQCVFNVTDSTITHFGGFLVGILAALIVIYTKIVTKIVNTWVGLILLYYMKNQINSE